MSTEAREFQDSGDCRDAIRELMVLPEGRWRDEVLEALVDRCELAPAHSTPALGLRIGRWAIRNEDLKLFASLRFTLLALADIDFFLREPTTRVISGVVMAIVEVAYNAHAHGSVLSVHQAAVVALLKAANTPLSVAEIAATVSSRLAPIREELSVPEVAVVLDSLKAIPTRSGTKALVEVVGTEKWALRGV